jgi:MoaA/NifB/PqqE/SkfB family radical SAM enzyme
MTPHENTKLMESEVALGKTSVAHLPTLLTIETTAICNLRCVMCPHAIDAVNRPKHLPLELMDQLEGLLPSSASIELYGIGEPLASPAFWQLLNSPKISSETELRVKSNLTILDDLRIRSLIDVDAKLTISVSLDAAKEETYRRIRGFDFSQVTTNISKLVKARGAKNYPRILLNMTLMRENIEEAPRFIDLAKKLGADAVQMSHLNKWPPAEMSRYRITRDEWTFDYAEQGLWNYPALSNRCIRDAQEHASELGIPLILDQRKIVFFSEADAGAGEPPAATFATADQPDDHETVRSCRYPWQWAMITSDGAVRPCCYADKVGDLNETPLADIWNGRGFRQLREDIQNGRVNRVCEGAACKYVQNTRRQSPVENKQRPKWLGSALINSLTSAVRSKFVSGRASRTTRES